METKVWRVNVHDQKVTTESVPENWKHLGGRGLIARILLDEVPPTCEPLGPYNKLIWSPGLLVGHKISSCDRISLGSKSPLTGGVKESNAGGLTGLLLAELGIKALIVEGEPNDDHLWILHVSKKGVSFDNADDLAGLGVYETSERLLARYGDKVGFSVIGPAGEMKMAAAGVLNLAWDKEPKSINARGGLGAVMGAKRIKAVVIDASEGKKPDIEDPELFNATKKQYTKGIPGHTRTEYFMKLGTSGMVNINNMHGGLPTRGFSTGSFEDAEKISGEALRETLLERGGDSNTTVACMPGCLLKCGNVMADANGKKIVSTLQYETISLIGSNLGLDSLDEIAYLNCQCNDLGIDTIEIGATIGMVADAGLMEFGNFNRALELVNEIRMGTPFGRILGNGAVTTARVFGLRRVPAVKGQAMAAYDPRGIKGIGVTYATSPQGADHTAGATIHAKVNHRDPSIQPALSLAIQVDVASYDTLGICILAGFAFAQAPQAVRDFLKARYGGDVEDDIFKQLGKETIKLELAFNKAAGFTHADDRIPEWMTLDPLPPHNAVFDVPTIELDHLYDEL